MVLVLVTRCTAKSDRMAYFFHRDRINFVQILIYLKSDEIIIMQVIYAYLSNEFQIIQV